MKKILLMLVALVATVTLSAKDGEEMEGWQKSFTPVANADDLAGIHTAVAGDGSVYASTTYNQTFTVGNITVADPDGLTSSCIVKFDNEGNSLWAVTLYGKCKIYAMTADADGTLYVAGKAEDAKVVCTGTDGKKTEIENPTGLDAFFEEVVKANVGFVAKITKDGLFDAVKIITPQLNATIGAIVGDPYEMGMDFVIYDISGNDPMFVTPSKIMLDGDKVYVAVSYTGDIPELGWSGAYLNYYGMDAMIFDITSKGVFSLSKSDLLGNAASVATVTPVETIQSFSQYAPESIDFVAYQGVPHVAFFGWGDLKLTTPAGSKDFSFALGEEDVEHALVLANVEAPTNAKVFNAAKNASLSAKYNLVGATIAGANCIMGGTFYGNFPLDNSITKDVNTTFVASIKMSDCSVNWTTVSPAEAEASCMVVAGEEIKASTNAATYTIKTATGEVDTEQTMAQSFDDADCYNNQYVSTIFTQETSVVVFSPKLKPSGINEAQAQKNGAVKYYNLNGIELTAPQNGLNIVKTADGTRKVLK